MSVGNLSMESWIRSSWCGPNGGNCVEINRSLATVAVRDSKAAHVSALVFGDTSWSTFLERCRSVF